MTKQQTAYALAKFLRWIIDQSFIFADAVDIQAKAEELGLVNEETYDPKKHIGYEAEAGEKLLILSDEVKTLLALDES